MARSVESPKDIEMVLKLLQLMLIIRPEKRFSLLLNHFGFPVGHGLRYSYPTNGFPVGLS